jgi:hypothetical protein
MKIEKLNEKVDWKVAMEGNNSNIDRLRNVATQVNIDPVMGEVIRENEESDKMTGDTFKELSKELDGITPKDPDTGKKITIKPYTEKLSLDESLFSEDYSREFSNNVIYSDNKKQEFADFINDLIYRALDNYIPNANSSIENLPDVSDYSYDSIVKEEKAIANLVRTIVDNYFINSNLGESKSSKKKKHLCEDYDVREYSDMLYDMIENDIVDAKKIAEDLIYWVSEDDIAEYMRVNEIIDDQDSDDEDYDESLHEKKEDSIRYFPKLTAKENTFFHKEGDWDILGKENSIYHVNIIACDKYDRDGKRKTKAIEDNDTEFLRKYGYTTEKSARNSVRSLEDDFDIEIVKVDLDNLQESLEESLDLQTSNLLKEYVDEDDVEEDEYTVYDLLNDRLFGYGINKSNFRQKWKFAEVEPTVKTSSGKLKRGYFYPTIHADELVTGKPDDRRAFVDGGVGVFVHDDEEATLAKKCAEELKLDFDMKKLVRPVNGFNYIAVIKVPDEIQEMPVKDYVESIGKSMKDFLRGRGEKPKADFTGSANYSSRKANKESEE